MLRLPPFPNVHPWLAMPNIDRKINDRGVLIDISLVKGLQRAAKIEKIRLDDKMYELTDGRVPKDNNNRKIESILA